jgi:Tol biopolymer transport system component
MLAGKPAQHITVALLRLMAVLALVNLLAVIVPYQISPLFPKDAQLAYVAARGRRNDLVLMNVTRGLAVSLTRFYSDVRWFNGYAWSPDGRYMLLTNWEPQVFDLRLLSADGRHWQRLTTNQGDHQLPAWSPDGQQIAFVANRDGPYQVYRLDAACILQTATCQAEPLRPEPGRTGVHAPTWGGPKWSPDGKRLAFLQRFNTGDTALFLADWRGGRAARLNPRQREIAAFAWSPDSRRIAYVAQRGHEGRTSMGVITVNCDDSSSGCQADDQDVLLSNVKYANPVWSPDGRWLAFEIIQASGWDIFVMDTACLSATANCPASVRQLTRDSIYNFSPAWSPDSQQIVFVSNRAGKYALYGMSPDGTGQRRLTFGERDAFLPAWRPG